ncbi:MAG: integrase [Alphaproteobacteria bacterium CG1_02_46_17]|nr:MAG: integrase [Alphaproteobacteria bacterium CG1_02_46_17]
MSENYTLMDGKVHVYKRDNSEYWQCSTYLNGRNHRKSTKHKTLSMAMEYAREWYMAVYVDSKRMQETGHTQFLLNKASPYQIMDAPAPSLHSPLTPRKKTATGPTFAEAAAKFIAEYSVITQGERNKEWTAQHEMRARVHLMPFFGNKPVKEINAGLVQEYRIARSTNGYKGKIPSRSTLHHETVTLRLVLKTAHRYGWIDAVPDISPPYKVSGKVKHRAWFSPEEYKLLYEATRERAKAPSRERYKDVWEDLHDYVLFMANTGLRPDEAGRLEYRDVTIVTDDGTGERLLEIEVRGKRGVGYCKSMTGAILPFQRMQKRHNGKPTDKIFGKTPRDVLNKVLDELNLKFDRDGNVRTAYSLRHTYICLRLMEGADIYQIAKNCRTSVEMIEQFYAAHLKNTLDASAINVKKRRRPKKSTEDEI